MSPQGCGAAARLTTCCGRATERPAQASSGLRLTLGQAKIMERPGIEPGTFGMQSQRSTTELPPLTADAQHFLVVVHIAQNMKNSPKKSASLWCPLVGLSAPFLPPPAPELVAL